MKITQQMKQRPNWGKLIKKRRLQMKLSQTRFGAMWDVTHAAVSDWEHNKTDPPGDVTWWLTQGGRTDGK